MFTFESLTGLGSESATSRPTQSAKRPSIRTTDGEETKYARTGPPRTKTGSGANAPSFADAPVTSTWMDCPGKNPGAETDAVITGAGWPWVKVTDSAERDTKTPGVAFNRIDDATHVVAAGMPSARTRIVKSEVGPAFRTVVEDDTSRRTAPPSGPRRARLRLDSPRKSSMYTRIRKFAGSNRSMSNLETFASTPRSEDAAGTDPRGCRWLQLTSAPAGKEYSRAPASE